MSAYKIIGNMTGNSMDAIDLVLTEFDGNKIKDICSFSKPYTEQMRLKMAGLRKAVFNKTKEEIEAVSDFFEIHNEYIRQIADCVNQMCADNGIDKSTIRAIGFHGKTLDHYPPSKALKEHSLPYTLQIGSGQMLADLTGIDVVYDFRSDLLMAGFEGAPLVGQHNAHIALSLGDGCYYNGGNTSNFAFIVNAKAVLSSDSGPFNEYTDAFIRLHTKEMFDQNGMFGLKGNLDKGLLQAVFDFGRDFYETKLPKSGDPAYYDQSKIFDYVKQKNITFEDAVKTFEYAAAYIAVQALTLVPENVSVPQKMVLFGGGWKNPVVKKSFEDLLEAKGFVLEEHQEAFEKLWARLGDHVCIEYCPFGEYMEARLMADLARYKLENKAWDKGIVCGKIAKAENLKNKYDDCVNRAAKGWQEKI